MKLYSLFFIALVSSMLIASETEMEWGYQSPIYPTVNDCRAIKIGRAHV